MGLSTGRGASRITRATGGLSARIGASGNTVSTARRRYISPAWPGICPRSPQHRHGAPATTRH
eukprot:6920873-Lingulodinium_polyedra.AAC.1